MKRWIAVFMSLGIVLMTVFGMICFLGMNDDVPLANDGNLNLSTWDFEGKGTLKLKGGWEFYPDELLTPQEGHDVFGDYKKIMEIVDVPGSWTGNLTDGDTANGVGTYRLQIDVPGEGIYGIKTNVVRYASQLFMNGQLVGSSGIMSKDKAVSRADTAMYLGTMMSREKQVEVVIQVANHDSLSGGIIHAVDFGPAKEVNLLRDRDRAIDALLILGYFILGLFYLSSFFQRRKDLYQLHFGLLCISLGLYLSTLNVRLFDLIIPEPGIGLLTNIQLLLSHLSVLFFLWFIHTLFKNYTNKMIIILLSVIIVIHALSYGIPGLNRILFSSLSISFKQMLMIGVLGAACVYITIILIRALINKVEESEFIVIIVTTFICNGLLLTLNYLFEFPVGRMPVYLFLIMVLCLSILMGNHFKRTYKQVDQLSKKLHVDDRLKDEFLMKTSLQLHAPLQNILKISQSLMEGTDSPLRLNQHKNVLLIHNISSHLANTVDDLMAASKSEQDGMLIIPITVNVKVIEDILEEMNILIPASKSLKIINKVSKSLPLVYVDEQRLKQIIFNLVSNAIDFTEEGEITISTEVVDNKINIIIADTGIGIEQEYLDLIFTSFFQVNENADGQSNGLGLGLAIVKQMVQLSDGNISVTSEINKGTCFTVTLPLVMAEQLKEESKQIQSLNLPIRIEGNRGYTILVVDDDHKTLKVLLRLIDSMAYTVIAVDNGHEALEIINQETVDLMIVDPMMPDMSGYDLCEIVRKDYDEIELPILIFTTTGQSTALATPFKLEANGVLRKPIYLEDVKAQIESLISMKKAAQEAIHSELSYFYAQITPHFLYNTLNTIIGLSYTDEEKTREALQHLATYFRAKLDYYNRDSVIPLNEEMELVQSYVSIEKMRYGERLDIQYDLDNTVGAMIPSLTIQPIVENAIQHGLLKKSAGGRLLITIDKVCEGTKITVEDNGIGMTKEKQYELLNEKTNGIGFANTIKKLKLIKNAQFNLESRIGEGTKVTIILPGEKSNESNFNR